MTLRADFDRLADEQRALIGQLLELVCEIQCSRDELELSDERYDHAGLDTATRALLRNGLSTVGAPEAWSDLVLAALNSGEHESPEDLMSALGVE